MRSWHTTPHSKFVRRFLQPVIVMGWATSFCLPSVVAPIHLQWHSRHQCPMIWNFASVRLSLIINCNPDLLQWPLLQLHSAERLDSIQSWSDMCTWPQNLEAAGLNKQPGLLDEARCLMPPWNMTQARSGWRIPLMIKQRRCS